MKNCYHFPGFPVDNAEFIEYFIWRNIKSPYYNSLFSILATLLLLIQPVVSLMLLSNEKLKYNMLMVYLVLTIPFAVYRLTTKRMYSVVSPGGHLQ